MGNGQDRRNEAEPGEGLAQEPVRTGRSGEGAASALRQLISQEEEHRRTHSDHPGEQAGD